MDQDPQKLLQSLTPASFLSRFASGILRDLFRLVIVFVIGTAAGAGACFYYGVPLVFSLGGGALALGVTAFLLFNM